MIDLSQISGLPLRFDKETVRVTFDSCVNCSHQHEIPLSSLIPTLLNKYLKYPEVVYSHHQNIAHIDDLADLNGFSYDIIVIPYGLLGIEYIRTHVFYSDQQKGKYDVLLEVLSGELTVVMQKNEKDDDPYSFETKVDSMHIVKLTKGDRIAIPTGYLYTFVNTSPEPVVFSKVTGGEHKPIDYSQIEKERGLAYYVISKNARTEIVPNPKYVIESEVEIVNLKDLIEDDAFFIAELYDQPKPLYHFFTKQHSFLSQIFK